MSHGLYLYGIFPTPGPQDLTLEGLDKQPVHTQIVDGFAFLFSEAQQERYLASRRNLLGHEKVLEQAMDAGFRTLLPLQFGLIIEDWQTVTQQLTAPHGPSLEQLFTKLTGLREVGVKVFWQADQELHALLDENPTLKAQRDSLEGKSLSMDDVIRIGQAIERALASRKQAIVDAFRVALNPFARQVVENDTLTESMIYNAAYLIPWDNEPEFSIQVEQIDQQFDPRLTIRYNNFTAPFNFAQLDRLD
ncbi:GvpL/GvpF family gas vesicle protein [Leptolyngbya sp. FACHB-36]|uniref:gas vesicle protein GvpF n=1 Tax=Leptolyngbya sp. FACHB-36 TaxID=2692808 RepID=UPI0016807B6F|nr:GvpL/GvpF family gas vesicle protein [Leptolyngbya sp. FACHB-36]MBD2019855.1 GvpL/GvpF family gas vesicle protein [Leptolyngbya sp. FACHB-36]